MSPVHNTAISIQENVFKKVVWKVVAILLGLNNLIVGARGVNKKNHIDLQVTKRVFSIKKFNSFRQKCCVRNIIFIFICYYLPMAWWLWYLKLGFRQRSYCGWYICNEILTILGSSVLGSRFIHKIDVWERISIGVWVHVVHRININLIYYWYFRSNGFKPIVMCYRYTSSGYAGFRNLCRRSVCIGLIMICNNTKDNLKFMIPLLKINHHWQIHYRAANKGLWDFIP